MRVIAGRYRGRRLLSPPPGVRPTTDRLREALFNVLGDSVADSVWADLFAGSGAVSIEALSRGARFVLVNESDAAAFKRLRRNFERCGIEGGFDLRQSDALRLLRQPPRIEADFVFLDPPYAFRRHKQLLERVGSSPLSTSATTILLEVFKKAQPTLPAGWQISRRLSAGDSHMLILRLEP